VTGREPVDRADQAAAEQVDVEPVTGGHQVGALLIGGEQIQQHRGVPRLVQAPGDQSVAGAVP
jgi:hypothetical protein